MPRISGPIVRGGTGFYAAKASDIKGAPQKAANAAARLAIDPAILDANITCYQEDNGFTYRLAADLTTWNVSDTGPSAGSGIARTAVKGVVTTGSAVPSGNGTFDAIAYITGEEALLNLATNKHLNGPYVVGAGTWTRRTTEDSAGEFLLGMTIPVTSSGKIAIFATAGTITLGSTALEFVVNEATSGTLALSTSTPPSIGYIGSVGTSAAAMRGDAVIPDLYRQFGDPSSLSLISLTNYPDRHRFWVSCFEDEFIYDSGVSGLTADGITVLTTSLGGTTRHIRACRPHLRWQRRTAWFVAYSGGAGNDTYDGTQSTHGAGFVGPLLTRQELYRRYGRGGDCLIDVAVTVTVSGTRTSTDYMSGFEINLGPSGSWTETGVAAEAFTISGPGRFALLPRGGVYQITPTTSVVGSAEGRSKTLLFLVDFDTSDNTTTTAWTYTLPNNSSANATALIEEKTSAAAEGATIKVEDALVKNGASAAVRKGSATQENFAAKSTAYSGVTYALGPATNDFRLTITNPNSTACRGTVLVALQVNPD